MCGITGFWRNSRLQDSAIAELKGMAHTLDHRGPDGTGFHLDTDAGLGMAHTRLSIIDLETGEQPLVNGSKSKVLTVNGEFYDYKRIRTELLLEGFGFNTKSDSEIAIPLYEKYGLDFVHRLRGEFAISFFDADREKLILVRDRFGIKPLYYCIGEDGIFYGSEIKALLAHPDIEPSFSPQSLVHQMIHTMVPGSTAFESIRAVKPGHMVIVTRSKSGFDINEKCYWDVDFPEEGERDNKIPADEHRDRVRSALLEAVGFRLEADVPVGCYLSGGIDSCSMLGLASSMQQAPVKAFTISFDSDVYDESSIAREMAERVGADHEMIRLSADDLYGDNYVKTLWHAERTFYNTLGVAKYCMSRRVHECGYKSVVTGEGADELFGGYPAFKRDMLLYGGNGKPNGNGRMETLDEKSNEVFKGAILSDKTVSHPAFDAICGFTPSWIQPWMQTYALVWPLFNDDIRSELKGYDPFDAIARSFDKDQIEGRHFLDVAQYTWIKTMLACQILSWGGDRVDMANSMESRPAFLDHHVAAVARMIPPGLRIKGKTEKWILREAMKNVITEELYKREKFAFMAPPGHSQERKRRALQRMIDEFMSPDLVREAGIFDEKRMNNFLKEYRQDRDPTSLVRKDAIINHLLGLHILHRIFIQKGSPASVAG